MEEVCGGWPTWISCGCCGLCSGRESLPEMGVGMWQKGGEGELGIVSEGEYH